jgi:hypothetical protein
MCHLLLRQNRDLYVFSTRLDRLESPAKRLTMPVVAMPLIDRNKSILARTNLIQITGTGLALI